MISLGICALAQNNCIPQRRGGADDNASEDFLAC